MHRSSVCREEMMTQLSWMAFPQRICHDRLVPAQFSVTDVTVVVPVKNNQLGVDRLLHTFAAFDESQRPAKIIVVDNNSSPAVVLPVTALSAELLHCSVPGPAAARNLGVSAVDTEWILFMDSDCIPTPDLLNNYVAAQDGSIAYSGFVRSSTAGWIARYYESQEILIPMHDHRRRPQYLVTANSLVYRPALQQVNGFCETFPLAAGEDIDLGFRLQSVGSLQYAEEAVVVHDFEECLIDFSRRFYRYGRGNRMLSVRYGIDLQPRMFAPNQPSLVNRFLAALQWLALRKGYFAELQGKSSAALRPQ